MHKYLPKIYYFIDSFNKEHIRKLNKRIAIIFRNYKKKPNISEIIRIKDFCKKTNHKFLIANYPEIAFKLKLDGIYIPSFYKKYDLNKYLKKTNFILIGSAHNLKEIRIKERQGVDQIFLSPVFQTKKSKKFLGVNKFNILAKYTNKKIIALGGINKNNINYINKINSYGFSSISYIKKYGQIKPSMLI